MKANGLPFCCGLKEGTDQISYEPPASDFAENNVERGACVLRKTMYGAQGSNWTAVTLPLTLTTPRGCRADHRPAARIARVPSLVDLVVDRNGEGIRIIQATEALGRLGLQNSPQ